MSSKRGIHEHESLGSPAAPVIICTVADDALADLCDYATGFRTVEPTVGSEGINAMTIRACELILRADG